MTPGLLRGARFRRLFPDVYIPAELDATLAVRAQAAGILMAGRGAVAGYAAAELTGASCGPADAVVDVLLLRSRAQSYNTPGLEVRRCRLRPGDISSSGGIDVTVPARTAFDLARWAPGLTERVVAVDAIAHRHNLTAGGLERSWLAHRGAHGYSTLPELLRLIDPRAESPMESRIRMALVLNGLPPPAVQHVVGPYRLDLAYPSARLGIEYDGRHHRTQEQAHHDLRREADLAAAGWVVVRFTASTVLHKPRSVVTRVRYELGRRTA
ncbi:endonuclease domain-containing protein [Pseudonocardia sp. TRM90224]|uniref:endonuclease domain-containing protein n=1 Tax=Pseudonocardia sp. TRM90224 TaxID=2812678 RepID=UPI001E6413C0|nr:DUF559 domain-containing protein [Pseudonocardia sp. TRM90224]